MIVSQYSITSYTVSPYSISIQDYILSHITQYLNTVSHIIQYTHIRKPGLHYFCNSAKVVQGVRRRISYMLSDAL